MLTVRPKTPTCCGLSTDLADKPRDVDFSVNCQQSLGYEVFGVKDACLKNYMNFESKERLLEALGIAFLLFPIYGVFAGYRMVLVCEQSKFTGPFQRHARPGLLLGEFIHAHK